jgi:Zn-dependent protease with chaperone function
MLVASETHGFRASAISPQPLPWFYRPAVILAAAAMLFLACAYFAVIAGVAGTTIWHAWEHTAFLRFSSRTTAFGMVLRLLFYFGPIIVGTVLTIFLIKPLFRSADKEWTPYAVTRSNEPVLFDFIERICASINAPMPTRVVLDLQPNASAALRRGMLSFASNDLVLTTGLPLVAALDAQQFAGVLAHEFGHFAQKGAMRLSYVVMGLSRWFARLIYDRDEWDYALAAASRGGKQGGFLLTLVNLAIWAVRGLLWLLMLAGQVVGCALSRQMEYHADRYETAIAGTDAFISTQRRLLALHAACQSTYPPLFHTFQEARQLPVDFPRYLISVAEHLPAKAREDLCRELAETKTKLLDTHPSARDRSRAATAANEVGIFQATAPASTLFRDFASVSRLLTCMHYRQDLGLEVTEKDLIPVEEWKPIHPPEEPPVVTSAKKAA